MRETKSKQKINAADFAPFWYIFQHDRARRLSITGRNT